MALDAEQATALQNLSRKAAGQHVGWINISAARADRRGFGGAGSAGMANYDRWRGGAAVGFGSGADPLRGRPRDPDGPLVTTHPASSKLRR